MSDKNSQASLVNQVDQEISKQEHELNILNFRAIQDVKKGHAPLETTKYFISFRFNLIGRFKTKSSISSMQFAC